MKKLLLILATAALGFGFAVAQKKPLLADHQPLNQSAAMSAPCRQGATRSCSLKGKPEQQICDDGVWTSCGNPKYIMTIEGLDSHPVELEISGFSLGPQENPTAATREAARRKVYMRDLQISKQHDAASQKLFHEALMGPGRIVRLQLRVDLTDDAGHLLSRWQYWFSDASVSNYEESGAGPEATETITFNFANMYRGPVKEGPPINTAPVTQIETNSRTTPRVRFRCAQNASQSELLLEVRNDGPDPVEAGTTVYYYYRTSASDMSITGSDQLATRLEKGGIFSIRLGDNAQTKIMECGCSLKRFIPTAKTTTKRAS